MFFLGGGQQESHWEGLRLLGEWVGRRVLRLESAKDGKAWGRELVMEVARRNGEMVAGWQVCCWRFFTGCVRTRH
jgi:serine/tyrosine/threonine adenylyltransferase